MDFHSFPVDQRQDTDLDLRALRVFVAIAESGSFIAGGKARVFLAGFWSSGLRSMWRSALPTGLSTWLRRAST